MRILAALLFAAALAGCCGVRTAAPAAAGPELAAAAAALEAPPPRPAPRLPDRIVLGAAYRLVLLDGEETLVRETDGAPGSLRILSGRPGDAGEAGEAALPPREMTAALAAEHAQAARLERALEQVMERSRTLSLQAAELGEIARRLEAPTPPPTPR